MKNPVPGGSLTALPDHRDARRRRQRVHPDERFISITDGQIFLETDLFYSGVRPAINVGLSVSRVGGNAQIKAMKSVAGTLKLDLAQYREKAAFSQFASDLDKVTRDMLERGVRLVEILKQGQYQPQPVERQIVIIYAGTKGYLDDLPTNKLGDFEKGLVQHLTAKHPKLFEGIRETKVLGKDLEEELKKAIVEFKTAFGKGETK